ncbi:somatomedin-B and thrombospondin type-1 domain-containing protein [Prorops nasuta]|uniref:somatomedin-B and thrombospondin type-1 domain-containing protein n=1 Tax=Prorops nasuta TaxID=863751 RepID=UPI0034CF328C
MTGSRVNLAALTILWVADLASAGSCSTAKLCCQGRDSGCVIQKESPNAIIESPKDKPCYCDHACLKLADCCDDFRQTCGVTDCAVGEWGSWSICDNGCGSGTQKRSRSVLVEEKNGGKHCPRLNQVRPCRSFASCRPGLRPFYHNKSIAILSFVPVVVNSTSIDLKESQSRSSTCITFTIVRTSRSCGKLSSPLMEGSQVCVQHGDSFEELPGLGRWRMSGSELDCHGKWIGDPNVRIDCADTTCSFLPRMTSSSQRKRRSLDGQVHQFRTSGSGRRARTRRRGRRRILSGPSW